MNETTRKQTIDAVRELYGERLQLIDRAIKAAELARDHVPYSSSFSAALGHMRQAKQATERQLENEIKYWEEKE